MFLAGHPSQGCFGLQSHCAPCYFFNQASFYPSDFSFRQPTPTDVGLPDAFKNIPCAGDKKKSEGLRSGERKDQTIGSPHPNHLPGYVAYKWYAPQSKNMMGHHRAWITRSCEQWPLLPAPTPEEGGNLHTCKFLETNHGALNPHIRLATSLIKLIVLLTACIFAIFTD
ncbi:hypothetical protein TNCV_792661 [Trichonephila clavipes]|nr:hypothetical protein TNCV_792661 [Trichonephila clavipes]